MQESKMTKSLKDIYEEDKNKCFHRIVAEAGAVSPCTDQTCEGYGTVEIGDMVEFCDNYCRATKIMENQNEQTKICKERNL